MHIQQQYIDELMWYVCLVLVPEGTLLTPHVRIWNTYKDEFARTRTRELSIIE